MDDLTLRYFVGDVSDVDNPRKFAVVALVEFNLCTIHKVPALVGHKLHIQSFTRIAKCLVIKTVSVSNYNSDTVLMEFPTIFDNSNNKIILKIATVIRKKICSRE